MKNKIIHLKGLNGLRAIAAIAVVISHTTLELKHFGLVDTIFGSGLNGKPKGLLLASYGVSIFFALSGFLITFLLLKEKEKTNKINIKGFYIRRILRIWPLYYFYILLCFIIYYIYNINYNQNVIPFYLFLTANIPVVINTMLPFLGHFWSIGVEEQFYLFWPWFAKKDTIKLLKHTFLLFIIIYTLKIIFGYLMYKYNISLPYTFINTTRIHTMLIGCIGAILYFKQYSITSLFTKKITQIISWLIILLIAINKFNISSLVDNEIVAVITVFIIFSQIKRTNFIFDLNNRIMDFIGKISYGIYVYHPLIIFITYKSINKFKESSLINYLIVYLFIISITIIISYLSYRFFESRFIKLKSKFAVIKSKA